MTVDVCAPVVVAELDGNITVTAEPNERELHADVTSRRWTGIRRSRGVLPGRSRKRPSQENSSDSEERASFIQFLQSASDESKTKVTLMQAQIESEILNATRLKAHTQLIEAQHMRERLEIEKLQKELVKTD